jgi:hypothetical protein
MTKLEELKAAADAHAAARAADIAYDVVYAAYAAYGAALDAYYAELDKQQTTPREPVEDEGNPLV